MKIRVIIAMIISVFMLTACDNDRDIPKISANEEEVLENGEMSESSVNKKDEREIAIHDYEWLDREYRRVDENTRVFGVIETPLKDFNVPEAVWGAEVSKDVLIKDYDSVNQLYNGVALVTKDGKYGYINALGEELTPNVFDQICPVNHEEGVYDSVRIGQRFLALDLKKGLVKEYVPYDEMESKIYSEIIDLDTYNISIVNGRVVADGKTNDQSIYFPNILLDGLAFELYKDESYIGNYVGKINQGDYEGDLYIYFEEAGIDYGYYATLGIEIKDKPDYKIVEDKDIFNTTVDAYLKDNDIVNTPYRVHQVIKADFYGSGTTGIIIEVFDSYEKTGDAPDIAEFADWSEEKFQEEKVAVFSAILFLPDEEKLEEYIVLNSDINQYFSELTYPDIKIYELADIDRDLGLEIIIENALYEYGDYSIIDIVAEQAPPTSNYENVIENISISEPYLNDTYEDYFSFPQEYLEIFEYEDVLYYCDDIRDRYSDSEWADGGIWNEEISLDDGMDNRPDIRPVSEFKQVFFQGNEIQVLTTTALKETDVVMIKDYCLIGHIEEDEFIPYVDQPVRRYNAYEEGIYYVPLNDPEYACFYSFELDEVITVDDKRKITDIIALDNQIYTIENETVMNQYEMKIDGKSISFEYVGNTDLNKGLDYSNEYESAMPGESSRFILKHTDSYIIASNYSAWNSSSNKIVVFSVDEEKAIEVISGGNPRILSDNSIVYNLEQYMIEHDLETQKDSIFAVSYGDSVVYRYKDQFIGFESFDVEGQWYTVKKEISTPKVFHPDADYTIEFISNHRTHVLVYNHILDIYSYYGTYDMVTANYEITEEGVRFWEEENEDEVYTITFDEGSVIEVQDSSWLPLRNSWE